jgi:hypothetical protein
MQRSNWQQAQQLGVLSCTMTLHTKANYATHQVIYIIYPTKLCNNYPQQIMLPHQYNNEEETYVIYPRTPQIINQIARSLLLQWCTTRTKESEEMGSRNGSYLT